MKIAIIPARGGSKRIPRKNIKLFCGKPMIAWSIEAAKKSGLFDHIIVSTDDAEIAEVYKQWGAEVPFMRPAELSNDYVGTGAVIKHAAEWAIQNLGEVEFVCTIYATAPFIKPADLARGWTLLRESDARIVFTVTSFPFPIQRAIRINENGRAAMFQPEHFSTRSQDLEPAYHDAGQFYWARTDAVLNEVPAFSEAAAPLILPRYQVQDIDTIEDWQRAELMFEALHGRPFGNIATYPGVQAFSCHPEDKGPANPTTKKWQQHHHGPIVAVANGFDVIECELCEFRHIVPIPTEEDLEKTYRYDYYTQEKPLYLERYTEDIDWWNMVYAERYEMLEQHLPPGRRRLLDIGSGPGLLLLNGQSRGWQVRGIEPSLQAVEHSRGMGLDVVQGYFSEKIASELGVFDAINMSLVLEHIPDPAALLALAHGQLDDGGLLCVVVPNDFNPFQLVARDHLAFKPWWVAPPHHINYFDFNSLQRLMEQCGFDVIHKEATFPIDMFLLMGDNYIGNDELGRACHSKRKKLELSLSKAGMAKTKRHFYQSLANIGLGREVVLVARKLSR